MDLFAKIKKMIARELAVDADDIVPEAHFMNDLGADSLGVINLVTAVEDRFEIEIEEDDLAPIENVGMFVALVEKKVDEQS